MKKGDMSNEQTDKEFRVRADAFIHLANEQRKNANNDKVNASLLYASTRFTAFIVASAAEGVEEMKEDRDEAVRYFTEKFREMLVENIDDYIGNYADYIQKFRKE
jgi:hypothetical protein